jgi:cell division protein FtsL
MFPIAYLCYWMEHTLLGILTYVGIFVALYIIIWFIQMYFWKKRIEGINKKLQEK